MERIAHYREMIEKDVSWKKKVEALVKNTDKQQYYWNAAEAYLDNEAQRYLRIRQERLNYLEGDILNQPGMRSNEVSKAQKRGVTLKEMASIDALWLYENQDLEQCPPLKHLKEIENGIRNNAKLMKDEQAKAAKRGISLDEMIMIDVFWIHNDAQEKKYSEIHHYEDQIRANPAMMLYMEEKAQKFGITLEEMIKRDVQYLYDQNHKEEAK